MQGAEAAPTTFKEVKTPQAGKRSPFCLFQILTPTQSSHNLGSKPSVTPCFTKELEVNPFATSTSFSNISDPLYKRSVAQMVASIKLRFVFKLNSKLASMKLKQTHFPEPEK